MYFIKSGKVAAILPSFNDFRFLKIKEGYYFGELDLLFYNEIRKYTYMAAKDSELLVLSKKHFKNIFFIEFREIGMDFINNAYLRKKKTRKIFKEAIDFCKINEKELLAKKTKEKFEIHKSETIYPGEEAINLPSKENEIFNQNPVYHATIKIKINIY